MSVNFNCFLCCRWVIEPTAALLNVTVWPALYK